MTARITTAGTAIAERLDILTIFNDVSSPPGQNSIVEELSTALLLQHRLNQPEMHYDTDESAWDQAADQRASNHRDEHPDGAADPDDANLPDDADLPDEPPF